MFFEKDGLGLEILDIFLINRKEEALRTTANRPFSVLGYRLAGRAHMYQNEKTYTLSESKLLYVPKNCTYSQDTRGERVIAVHLNVSGAEGDELEVIPAPHQAKLFFLDLYRAWTEKKENYRYACQIRLMQFLMELPRAQGALDGYLHQRLSDPELSVAQLARQSHVSEQYFRRSFKKKYGVSPRQYLNDARIDYAKSLLLTDYYTVGEVARMSGFEDANYFSTAFKKRVGQTPLEYKKNNCRTMQVDAAAKREGA